MLAQFASQFSRLGGLSVALGVMLCVTAVATGSAGDWQSPLVIPAAEFVNNGVYPGEDNFYLSDGFVTGRTNRVLKMLAPVNLPDGVTITRFEAALVDIGECSSKPDVEVGLRSFDIDTGAAITHAIVESNDNANMELFADPTISNPTVNNLDRGYFVVVSMCGEFQAFQAVRIHYTE